MKNNAFVRLIRIFAVAIATLLIQGCASNGYISSSITTGIGLDVSENPQTQIPHVRFGYIRHGLYYIPTGKTGDPTGNVTETPHVVSKIHVSSEFLKGITISEKFAVGDGAGNSEAARQLFADTSTETKGATVQAPQLAPASSADQLQTHEARKAKYRPEKRRPMEGSQGESLEEPLPGELTDFQLNGLIDSLAAKQQPPGRNAEVFKTILTDNGITPKTKNGSPAPAYGTQLLGAYAKFPQKRQAITAALKAR